MESNKTLEILELSEKYTNDKDFRNAMMNKAKVWNDENISNREETSTQEQENTQSISKMARENRIIKG